ncbi:MAG: zinc ribbon domain-containing protein [Lachnospiraceae bacterium]|nr:zinc ribbon domain-containing protein [Lachnospiraceae bacterium]
MKCPKCNLDINDNIMFCNHCGAKVSDRIVKIPKLDVEQKFIPVLYGPPREEFIPDNRRKDWFRPEKKTNKLMIPFIIVASLLLMAVCFIVFNIASGSVKVSTEDIGFSTSEEALEYYVNCLKGGDVEGALQSCAINHIAENYDMEAYIERLKSLPSTVTKIFNNNSMINSISSELVRGQFAKDIFNQYWSLGGIDPYADGMIIKLSDYSSAGALIDDKYPSGIDKQIANMKIIKFVKPAEVISNYNDEMYAKYTEPLEKIYGGKNYSSIGALVEVGGKQYLITCDTIKYGSKTYICNFYGYISMMLGESTTTSGVVSYD